MTSAYAGITVRHALDADADAIADVWLGSFSAALPGVRRAHSDEETRGWIRDHVVRATECWVAVVPVEDAATGPAVVGMMSVSPGWIDQLYVAPDHQGRGVGTALVRVALDRDEPLELWTFQVNVRARGFYRGLGFREVELTDGAGNEEREPDVRLARP